MAEVRLIAMPYELGRLREGVGRGPERLLELGAAGVVEAAGTTVRVEIVELSQPHDNEIDAAFELMALVAGRVRSAVADGAFPVVLSGSCFAAVGVVAGLDERAPGVVWFDAHGDFNEPSTAVSGYVDGMGVAILTGSAWQALRETVLGAPPVPESAVVLAGVRDLDQPEEPRLAASRIAVLDPQRLAAPGALVAAVSALDPAPTALYLHIDLDVLDAEVNVFSSPGGPAEAELEALVGALLGDPRVRALSLTAYDPACDAAGRIPAVAMRLLSAVAAAAAGGASSRSASRS